MVTEGRDMRIPDGHPVQSPKSAKIQRRDRAGILNSTTCLAKVLMAQKAAAKNAQIRRPFHPDVQFPRLV
jgi:hypothetical protein